MSGQRRAVDSCQKINPPEPTGISVALSSNAVAGIFRFPCYALASSGASRSGSIQKRCHHERIR